VPLACLNSFHVITCSSLCALQSVSFSHKLKFFLCSDLSIHLCSLNSSLFPYLAFFRLCVPLDHFLIYEKQTCVSHACLLECELPSFICLLSAFSYLLFSGLKALVLKLSTLCAKVLLLFYSFIFLFTDTLSATPFNIW
jgi:hypothetical protein